MKNTGKRIAFDKDKRRLDTLIKLTSKAGCKNITAVHSSFLDAKPTDKLYSQVEYILLDPSCSGSGIVGRMDHLLVDPEQEETSVERLESLSQFQKQALLHAFSFPSVKKVVYSTCSKHEQENEDVVKYVLEQNSDFELIPTFPAWSTRGRTIENGTLF